MNLSLGHITLILYELGEVVYNKNVESSTESLAST